MKRILIVDDHYIFRQGLKKIIADAFVKPKTAKQHPG